MTVIFNSKIASVSAYLAIIIINLSFREIVTSCSFYNDQAGVCANGFPGYLYTNEVANPPKCYVAAALRCNNTIMTNVMVSCPAKCYTCLYGGTCTACEMGYYSSPDCFPCWTNCADCPDNSSCTTCKNNAYKDGLGACNLCSIPFNTNCASCIETQCYSCSGGLFLDLSAPSSFNPCVSCPANCLGCSDGPTCLGCPAFFDLIANNCAIKNPLPYCLTYNNDGTCASCLTNFTYNGISCYYTLFIPHCLNLQITGVCQDCYSPFILQIDNITCQPTIPIDYCSAYVDADGSCSGCFPAFLFNGSACTVTNPIDYCQIYQDNGTCKSCFSSFIKGTTPPCIIINLILNCQHYQDDGSCKNCYSPFTKSFDSLACIVTSPQNNCQFYNNDGTCSSCYGSFTLQSNLSCLINTPKRNCQLYLDDGNCKSCYSPFTVSSDNLTCIINNSIQYCEFYEDNGTCSSCYGSFTISADFLTCTITTSRLFCQIYQNDGTCKSCVHTKINNYAIEADKLSCYDCNTVSRICYQCNDQHKCQQCSLPFQVDSNGYCQLCVTSYQNVSGNCVSNDGCINKQAVGSNTTVCLGCSSDLYFQYDQLHKECICQAGYKKILSGAISECKSVCGNGILTSGEQCDDNNLVNDDGCDKFCVKQLGFQCTPSSPSKCTLNLQIDDFVSNYAQKIDGDKCRFSFTIHPAHESLQFVEWKYYLTTNLTEQDIVKSSQTFTYRKDTQQIILEFQYKTSIQNVIVQATLTFDNDPGLPSVRLLQENLLEQSIEEGKQAEMAKALQRRESTRLLSTSQGAFQLSSSPSSRSLTMTIIGINEKLTFRNNASMLDQANKITSILYVIVSVLILLQFIAGSYVHKMIGLETIQIFQFIYFARMILDQNLQGYFKSVNILKYTAFGGYNNWLFFYSISQNIINLITRFGDNVGFNSIGLVKYFSLNINVSLLFIPVFLLAYVIYLANKYYQRSKYILLKTQSDLDLYTIAKRKCQWIYNHLVFPTVMLFNIISFFITILYFNSLSISPLIAAKYQQYIKALDQINIPIHLAILYITVFIYCYELFLSFQQYRYSKLTEQQRQKVPKSVIQKLEHDQNNPSDQENYKPGYVFVYLSYYLFLQLLISISLFVAPNIKVLLLYALMAFTILYVIVLFIWNPYFKCTNAHNMIIKYNHFALLLFVLLLMIVTSIKQFQSSLILIMMNYLLVLLLVVIAVLGYVRVYIQYQFRKKLEDDIHILTDEIKEYNNQCKSKSKETKKYIKDKDIKHLFTRRQLLLQGNSFAYNLKHIQKKAQCFRQNRKHLLDDDMQAPRNQQSIHQNPSLKDQLRKPSSNSSNTSQSIGKKMPSAQDSKQALKKIKQKMKEKMKEFGEQE